MEKITDVGMSTLKDEGKDASQLQHKWRSSLRIIKVNGWLKKMTTFYKNTYLSEQICDAIWEKTPHVADGNFAEITN